METLLPNILFGKVSFKKTVFANCEGASSCKYKSLKLPTSNCKTSTNTLAAFASRTH